MEFIAVQGEIIEKETGCRQPEFSQEQKIRLAYRGKKLNEFLLGQIETVFSWAIHSLKGSAFGDGIDWISRKIPLAAAQFIFCLPPAV